MSLAIPADVVASTEVRPSSRATRRFRPTLSVGHQRALLELGRRLAAPGSDAVSVVESVVQELNTQLASLEHLGLASRDLLPTMRLNAPVRILRDLVIQGWQIRFDDEGLMLDPPSALIESEDDPERAKEAIRRSLSFAR